MFNKSNILKNISYSFIANCISMLISVLMIIFLPKILSVRDYGTWQLYVFYTSYLGFFHFGWLDGIYLRYGGCKFEQLDKGKFSGQLYALFLFEVIITIILLSFVHFEITDILQKEVLFFVALLLVPVMIYTFSSFILQITNRIKDYAKYVLFERIVFAVLIVLYLSSGYKIYTGLFYINLTAKISAALLALYFIRGLIVFNFEKITNLLKEIYNNISVGSKLLFANIASMLILGIMRFGISQYWNVETFGKVSLALSIANFLMVFINAVSVALFPVLKRTDGSELKTVFLKIDLILNVILLMALALYYPMHYILNWWLPQYSDSLTYVSLLFPICFLESKVVLLFNTYLKALRQETLLLKINLGAVCLSLAFTAFCAAYLHNLQAVVFSILLLFIYKYVVSKFYLLKTMEIKEHYIEILPIIIFVLLNSLQYGLLFDFAIYFGFYAVYLYLIRNRIKIILPKR